jgi:tRNA-binding EMAP/Myf-like protein
MRGLESNGMLLAASLEGGKPVLASFLEEVGSWEPRLRSEENRLLASHAD